MAPAKGKAPAKSSSSSAAALADAEVAPRRRTAQEHVARGIVGAAKRKWLQGDLRDWRCEDSIPALAKKYFVIAEEACWGNDWLEYTEREQATVAIGMFLAADITTADAAGEAVGAGEKEGGAGGKGRDRAQPRVL